MPTTPTTIYDAYGRPAKHSKLLERDKSAPSLMGVRTPWFDPIATGLTPLELAYVLRDATEGETRAYLTLAEEMEERDLHYASVLATRRTAIKQLPVYIDAVDDSPAEERLAEELRALTREDTFLRLIHDMSDAIAKGYSISEIEWERSESQWWPAKFKWRDPRYFLPDRETGDELLLVTTDNPLGEILPAYAYVQHRAQRKNGLVVRGGLAFLAARAYLCKSYSLKDWLAFAEVFGLPLRIGEYDEAATAEDKAKLLSAVANLGSDAAAIVPSGMMIRIIDGAKSTGGDRLFEGLANYFNKETSKAVLGQTMTSEDGSSLAQAKVHDKVREDILRGDGVDLAATLYRDVIRPFVDLNYGPRPRGQYPRIRLEPRVEEDLKGFTDALTPWVDRGLRIEASAVRDKFGLDEPDDNAEILQPKGGATAEGPTGAPAQPAGGTPPERTAKNTATFAEGEPETQDEVEKLVRAALETDWVRLLDEGDGPTAAMRSIIDQAQNYDELRTLLRDYLQRVNSAELVEHLATKLFQARGLGDATDEVEL